MRYKLFALLPVLLFPIIGNSQSIDHWEAAVVAGENWRYRLGTSEPPTNWMQPGFNDLNWLTEPGGFGYSDGDDNTVIDPPILSVYLRKEFTIIDTAAIAAITLYADYDDAFVAYFNGVEIARANIGTPGVPPAYNAPTYTDREAQMYQGGLPEPYPLSPQQLDGLWQNGTNTLAIQIQNVGVTSSDMSGLFFLLFGITDASMNYQPVPGWFPDPFVSSNLPLLLIDTDGQTIPDEPKIDAQLGIIDNGSGNQNFLTDPFNGYDGLIGIELRGSSSLFFAKKNYALETRLPDGSNNNVPLLGMPAENDWVLHGPYSDKSLLRNVLSFHIGRSMDRYAPRTRWCELFINGQYMGVYVLMEKIKRDDNRVDIAELQPEDIFGDEVTGGYIFSADRDEQGPESGWYSPYAGFLFYKFQDPDYDELMPEQKAYIQNYMTAFEADMNNFGGSEIYEQYIDVPSWIDYWIATEIQKHIDCYRLSFFMYKTKDSNGGKLYFGPLWDLNLAYGNFDFGQDPGPPGWSWAWEGIDELRPFWIVDLSEDPDIQNQTKCRWDELRQGPLHTDSLLQFIDEQVDLLAEAQERNFQRWPVLGTYVWPNSYVGDTYQEEVDFLKSWLTGRLNWMDTNMPGDCSLVNATYSEVTETKLSIYPNPAGEEVNFRWVNPGTAVGEVSLYNALGERILTTRLTAGQTQSISVAEMAGGIYFYQLQADKRIIANGKLIVEK